MTSTSQFPKPGIHYDTTQPEGYAECVEILTAATIELISQGYKHDQLTNGFFRMLVIAISYISDDESRAKTSQAIAEGLEAAVEQQRKDVLGTQEQS